MARRTAITPPKSIAIWQDSRRGVSRCRGCDARIEWVEIVASGKRMCFDRVIVLTAYAHSSGRLIEVIDLTQNHWATCPAREQFARRS